MKEILICILMCCAGLNVIAQDCNDVPEINQQIVRICNSQMNKKVDRGECWDLAKLALDGVGAEWDGDEEYGKKINYKKECILPGDILLFNRVRVKYREGNVTYTESMVHHTAIVDEVKNQSELQLIHQNTGQHGRKVGKTKLNLDTIISGKMIVYRPVKSHR